MGVFKMSALNRDEVTSVPQGRLGIIAMRGSEGFAKKLTTILSAAARKLKPNTKTQYIFKSIRRIHISLMFRFLVFPPVREKALFAKQSEDMTFLLFPIASITA